jgi:hypothetical protein
MTETSLPYSRPGKRTRILIAAAWLACVIAWLILFIHVEPAVVTGPIISVLGIVMLFNAHRTRRRDVLWLGVAHIGLCILFFLLVNLNNWSPAQAFVPFVTMGFSYIAAAAVPTWFAYHREMHVPGVCDSCGYALTGLPEPRCPECGRSFDLAELSAIPA